MRRAILFRCHYLNAFILDVFRKIQDDCPDDDVFLLYDATHCPIETDSPHVFIVSEADARKTTYPFINFWYHGDYPLLLFYKHRPEYEYYWMIDHDVRFTGCWRTLFDSIPQSDFAGTDVARYHSSKDWFWWREKDYIPLDDRLRVKAFFPVVRFSNRALNLLDRHRGKGANGFLEWAPTTILNSENYSIIDLGDHGEFTPSSCRGHFYSPDTFKWRPVMEQAGQAPDWLYHPVRESTETAQNKTLHVGGFEVRVLPAIESVKTAKGTGCIVFDMRTFSIK